MTENRLREIIEQLKEQDQADEHRHATQDTGERQFFHGQVDAFRQAILVMETYEQRMAGNYLAPSRQKSE